MDKTTVYVVTSGTYSDYKIEGIFSTREKAVKLQRKCVKENPCLGADIDEWIVDVGESSVIRS